MNIAQIETNLQDLIATFNKEDFIYELLLSYGSPKASITRLRKGNLNLSKVDGDIAWKKKLYFREEQTEDLHLTISNIAKELKHDERFVVVTDYTTLLAMDTKTNEGLDIPLKDLPKHYDFFLPWAGMEKAQHAAENPADVKAAVRMAKLFDRIKKDNPDDSPAFLHGLNVFLSRLLFCYFAEDTHIFEEGQFTNAIASHTQTDGSDLNTYLDNLFTVLNTPEDKRRSLSGAEVPAYLNAFPFVNGGLFRDKLTSPKFSRSSRAALLEGGDQDWSAINPDIFGSMFQASVSIDQRGNLGQHYTSVPNIMKVIEPLFLNELYEEFEKAGNDKKKLNALLTRIHNLKIFDPACGSGNFLIIAYKELRILEMKIFKAGQMMALSGIELSQFYGIEIDDFAGEIAKLALWLAEHQMNVEFYKEFGRTNPTLPLKEAGKIVIGNACRLDWEEVCPKNEGDEIYVLGNPPYRGKKEQTKQQKDDVAYSCKSVVGYKVLDFISPWFIKAANFISTSKIKSAFVSTNSICEGEQVGILWPNILDRVEISFAYTSFKWKNSAKDNAGVTVVIIGLQQERDNKKKLFIINNQDITIKYTRKINPYLSTGSDVIVSKKTNPLSALPPMQNGSMPNDGGNFLLDKSEFKSLPFKVKPFYKRIIGANELFNDINRYCLWLYKVDENSYDDIPEIQTIVKRVREYRLKSKRKATNRLAKASHLFGEIRYKESSSIIVPGLSSERRKYIPIAFLKPDIIVSNLAQVIYDAEPWLFGLVFSKINNVWVRATSGRLETRVRYSPILSYNTFPFPPISTQRKNEITQAVFRILEEREKHSDKTLAQLYDPDKMPEGLREAHRQNDIIVEKCYRSRPFESDEERLEYLFKLYEQMIEEEKQRDTLFEKEKKTRKKR